MFNPEEEDREWSYSDNTGWSYETLDGRLVGGKPPWCSVHFEDEHCDCLPPIKSIFGFCV